MAKLLIALAIAAPFALRGQGLNPRVVEHGVELYQKPEFAGTGASFWELFASMYRSMWSVPPRIPFRHSVAILVGVSDYTNLRPLPGVNNDLTRMRDFLLYRAGFDEVYLARSHAATPATVQHYMMDVFHDRAKLADDDRLLFYYSGHGDDAGSANPYLQFAGARPGHFGDDQVLPVDSYQKWSIRALAKHALFIFDACVAGEVLSPQGDEEARRRKGVLDTLSGKGSRTVVTAGTFSQRTWYSDEKSRGYSVFTEGFLRVLEDPRAPALMSIDEIIGRVQVFAAEFARNKGVDAAIPQAREFDTRDKPGRFVFLNSAAQNQRLPEEAANALGLTSKGDGTVVTTAAFGYIDVRTRMRGNVFIDGQYNGPIAEGDVRRFKQAVGEHRVELKGTLMHPLDVKPVDVATENGIASPAAFGWESPIDDTGAVPVGTLVVASMRGLEGEVYIDYHRVGHLDRSRQVRIPNVRAGPHWLQIYGTAQESGQNFSIVANKEYYTEAAPAPPTNLTATPH